jgi:hypothetical protein
MSKIKARDSGNNNVTKVIAGSKRRPGFNKHVISFILGGCIMPVRVFKAEMPIETDGNVDLRDTGITALPDNLSVGGRVIGFEPPAPSG